MKIIKEKWWMEKSLVEQILFKNIQPLINIYTIAVLIILRIFQNAITDEVFRNNVHIYVNRQWVNILIHS